MLDELRRLRREIPKLQMFDAMIQSYADPPASPADCIFARSTECFSADLERRITPCQFGGNPDCSQCGCIASAGMEAIGRHKLGGAIPVGRIFNASLQVGHAVKRLRGFTTGTAPSAPGSSSAARRLLVGCQRRVDASGVRVGLSTPVGLTHRPEGVIYELRSYAAAGDLPRRDRPYMH